MLKSYDQCLIANNNKDCTIVINFFITFSFTQRNIFTLPVIKAQAGPTLSIFGFGLPVVFNVSLEVQYR